MFGKVVSKGEVISSSQSRKKMINDGAFEWGGVSGKVVAFRVNKGEEAAAVGERALEEVFFNQQGRGRNKEDKGLEN